MEELTILFICQVHLQDKRQLLYHWRNHPREYNISPPIPGSLWSHVISTHNIISQLNLSNQKPFTDTCDFSQTLVTLWYNCWQLAALMMRHYYQQQEGNGHWQQSQARWSMAVTDGFVGEHGDQMLDVWWQEKRLCVWRVAYYFRTCCQSRLNTCSTYFC